ncbi:Solute carrier family 25 member 35 [Sarcoptes scabiei]|uniref:Solute carrier family 25 member 35 n=1 Tax=Sarcoptes scabiei TaxID=52283 RepID=A0A834RIG8_SARSC|nr:Solute carrier family 25 member 35 [Sarcoptes scabiei]
MTEHFSNKFIQWDELLLGGIGAACAGVFTNPLEVIKTRIQLQGELRSRGQYTVHYRNVFQAFFAVVKNENLFSLQKGLVPAIWYQFIMNGCRFGLYQVCDNLKFTRNHNGEIVFVKSIACGIGSSVVGAFIGSPLYLVKTHLQSKSDSMIMVGHQHGYTSMTKGLKHIYRTDGILGLWRGSLASIIRISIGGSIQLTSFNSVKTYLSKKGWIDANTWYGVLLSSILGSFFVVTTMTPFDIISTRLYNQPVDPISGRGKFYNGILDCIYKMFKTEGILSFYKGFSASFLRLGPHTVLSIFFWQFFRNEYIYFLQKES